MHADPTVASFAAEIATRFGRSAAEVEKDGLTAYDFGTSKTVELDWPDGSRAVFKHAFAVKSADGSRIGVFTEHCGYYSFAANALTSVAENERSTLHYDDDA